MNSSKNKEPYFEGGYFIYRNLVKENNYSNQIDLMVTLPYNHGIKNTIISLIHKAKKSIKLCSFILSDPEIYTELNSVLSERKIAVFILTQLDNSKLSTSFLSEEEAVENFYQKHLDYIGKLYINGAHIRAAKSAHSKFIIIDDTEALVMSANITTPSLNENPESGVFVADKDSLHSLVSLFDIIYQYGTEYTKFKVASKDKQFVVSRITNMQTDWLKQFANSNIKFTWGNEHRNLYLEILNLINNGDPNGKIIISTYSVVGLDNIPEFLIAIKSYIEKGGVVDLFCRGMNYRSDHLKNCTILSQLGVRIYGDLFNHSKGIISNDKGFIFTANIDGNHGLINGFEIGYCLEDDQKINLENFINWQIENAPYEFKINPSKNDFFETYQFYSETKGINVMELPKCITFNIPNGDPKLKNELNLYPIYVHCNSSKLVQSINVGNSYYSVNMFEDKIEILEKVNRVFNSETYLLQCEDITINVNQNITK
ncbi:phospholipase D family protein [Yeosuana sp.]|uniref:phospholipase D family protein n=1 Tax=Yeosuana sp. TaxID=2529388 RepID=UPI004055285D